MDTKNNTPTANPLEAAVRDLCGKVDAYLKQGCLRSELYHINERVKTLLDSLPEQPVEGLEAEVERYFNGWNIDLEYGDVIKPDYTGLSLDECKEIARHFYDFGCRHTAVMYDDIECERQRAEEAELSGDLEEEIKRYNEDRFDEYFPEQDGDFISSIDFKNCMERIARHFAEWGAEHLKR